MYKVIVDFTGVKAMDGTTKIFRIGVPYPDPSTGFNPSESRISYLLSDKTSFKRPVIEEVQEEQPKEEKPKGRGRSSRG